MVLTLVISAGAWLLLVLNSCGFEIHNKASEVFFGFLFIAVSGESASYSVLRVFRDVWHNKNACVRSIDFADCTWKKKVYTFHSFNNKLIINSKNISVEIFHHTTLYYESLLRCFLHYLEANLNVQRCWQESLYIPLFSCEALRWTA